MYMTGRFMSECIFAWVVDVSVLAWVVHVSKCILLNGWCQQVYFTERLRSVSVFYWAIDVSKHNWLKPSAHGHLLIMMIILIIIFDNNMIHGTGAELGFPYCGHFKRSKTLRFALTINLRVLCYSQNREFFPPNDINRFVSTSEA